MKFTISSASDPYVEPFAEKPANRGKLKEFKPVEQAIWNQELAIWMVVINSLYDLAKMIEKAGHGFIVTEREKSRFLHITVYDDYVD